MHVDAVDDETRTQVGSIDATKVPDLSALNAN